MVHDVVTEKGKPVEVTDDWYAQDKAGNIWYLGEFTKEYENGKFKNTGGSFEAGVDGAQAGVIMPAKPRPGLRYRQEYYKGEAEDKGSIVSLREQAEVPFGHFRRGRVLMTKDTTRSSRRSSSSSSTPGASARCWRSGCPAARTAKSWCASSAARE